MSAVSMYLRATFASVEPDTTNLYQARCQNHSLNRNTNEQTNERERGGEREREREVASSLFRV